MAYAPSSRSRRTRQRRTLRLCCLFLGTVLTGLLLFIGWSLHREARMIARLQTQVTIEAGTSFQLSDFVGVGSENARFLSDPAAIDTAVPGVYSLDISLGRERRTVQLTVRDTLPPQGEPAEVVTEVGILPPAEDCVQNLQDATPVTVSYQTPPQVEVPGTSLALVQLADAAGNTAVLEVPVQVVLYDREPPVIRGAADLEAFVGDTIAYKKDILVTDDQDPNPTLEVDVSQVHLAQAGTYPVTYRATDASGNTAAVTVTLTLREKPATYVEPEIVYEMADKILAQITDDSMDDMQKGYAIYWWVRHSITYTGYSDKTSWTRGAYDAFTARTGDCFSYYAASKALLDRAGIENIRIEKSDTSRSQHFWNLINLGTGWYHFDASPRNGGGANFYMLTDAELEAYSVTHNNTHIFDPEAYPARSTQSVQDQIDYRSDHLVR